MLTTEERLFYDVWFREDCGYDEAVYATPLAHSRGIGYGHFARMYPFYVKTWEEIGFDWPDGCPALPKDQTPPCPWSTKEAMETRLNELETGPYSSMTYKVMREYMLGDSTRQ
jgi:hypothetical protein